MSDQDSDSEDPFEFKSKVDFDLQQNEKQNEMSNSHHFRILSEINSSFFQKLETLDDFDIRSRWRSYSPLEPIKVIIDTQEKFPGICDLIKPNNNFFTKVITTFNSLFIEIENTLPSSSLNIYETLYPLAVYGERPEGEPQLKEGDAEQQIARMISYMNEIYDKLQKLLVIGINLFNQIISLYSKQNNRYYSNSYKWFTFSLPFDYMGIIFSYFLAIDNIVNNNTTLKEHWDKYRLCLHQCKSNPGQYGLTEENKKKLEKVVKKINSGILEKNCYKQCVEFLIMKTGLMSPSGSGIGKTTDNKEFNMHFQMYMSNKIKKLNSDIGTFNESNEQMQLFQYIALFGIYGKLYNGKQNLDKELYKSVWAIQKKITTITIVGSVIFTIEEFLSNVEGMKQASPEPKNVNKRKKESFLSYISNFPNVVNVLRLNAMTWITRLESDLFETKVELPPEEGALSENRKRPQLNFILNKSNSKVKIILYGYSLANYLRSKISYILETFVNENMNITPNLIGTIAIGIEVIKLIQCEFNRIIPYIALNLNIINRSLLSSLQDNLNHIIRKMTEITTKGVSKNEQYYKDVNTACGIMFTTSQGAPSKIRRLILQFCFELISSRDLLATQDTLNINYSLWKLEVINQLSKEIERACDCSFLSQYQDILPVCLASIFNNKPERLYFFSMALNDTEIPFTYNRYEENNGMEAIKKHRKEIYKILEENFLKVLSRQIENDLRRQVHSVLIKKLLSPEPSEVNYKSYLTIKKFPLFDMVIDVKRYVEEYFNITFYKMTTLNINDWKTYQQMRVLAKSKYLLNLHDVFLPSQSLEHGKDILQIIRNLNHFVQNYTYNLNSQIFLEKNTSNELKTISTIGINQILNSLYTHGTGIINSIVNATYQYLAKALKKILVVISDEFIKSRLYDEMNFWKKNKSALQYKYPFERGEKLLRVIESNSEHYSSSIIDQIVKIVKQIGNAVSLIRSIRTALMDYNSQNSGLLTRGKVDDFQMMTQGIILEIENIEQSGISVNLLSNIQNAFNDANQIFVDTISSLKQAGDNNINYLSLLVTSFGDALAKVPDIDLFVFLFTAITITHMEKCIVATDNLSKNIKDQEMYFSDDGFIVGICYLLKVFQINKLFDSLNWFPSVIEQFKKDKKKEEMSMRKSKKSSNGLDIKSRRARSYLDGFEILYFTYSSATVLFNE